MACGLMQVLPKWGAYAEWAKDVAFLIDCTSLQVNVPNINTVGGVMDRRQAIEALDWAYRNRPALSIHGDHCLNFARQPEFSWATIGAAYSAYITDMLSTKAAAA